MVPHCGGWVEAGGFSSACRQTVIWSVVVHGIVGGVAQETGLGGLEFTGICVGSRLEAFSTASTAAVTVPFDAGGPLAGKVSPQVAHVARAAVIAPCCAACWMVE